MSRPRQTFSESTIVDLLKAAWNSQFRNWWNWRPLTSITWWQTLIRKRILSERLPAASNPEIWPEASQIDDFAMNANKRAHLSEGSLAEREWERLLFTRSRKREVFLFPKSKLLFSDMGKWFCLSEMEPASLTERSPLSTAMGHQEAPASSLVWEIFKPRSRSDNLTRTSDINDVASESYSEKASLWEADWSSKCTHLARAPPKSFIYKGC